MERRVGIKRERDVGEEDRRLRDNQDGGDGDGDGGSCNKDLRGDGMDRQGQDIEMKGKEWMGGYI